MLDELAKLLEGVPRSYPSFVNTMLGIAEDLGITKQLIDYIKANPEANSSDVLKFYTTNFMEPDEEDDVAEDYDYSDVVDEEEE